MQGGTGLEQKEGICTKESTTNGSIHDNEVYNAKVGLYITGTNINIYNNRIHDCPYEGIGLSNEGDSTTTGINVYNNLSCFNNRGFAFFDYSGAKSFNLINNTFYHNRVSEIYLFNSGYTNSIIRNNIIVGTNDILLGGTSSNITIDHNLFFASSYNGSNIYGSDYLRQDPQLNNPGSGDFALKSTSPAIDAGSSSGAPSTDYAGTSRPQGAGYDIGAFEYGSTAPAPNPTPVTATFGLNSGNQTWNQSANILDAMRFQNTAGTGTLNKLELLFDTSVASGKVRFGIYADNNGKPGNLLLDAGEATISNGWVSISGLNLPVTQGSYYWLSFIMSAGNGARYQTQQPTNSHYWLSYNYGTLPGVYPTSGLSTNPSPYVMRATVNIGTGSSAMKN